GRRPVAELIEDHIIEPHVVIHGGTVPSVLLQRNTRLVVVHALGIQAWLQRDATGSLLEREGIADLLAAKGLGHAQVQRERIGQSIARAEIGAQAIAAVAIFISDLAQFIAVVAAAIADQQSSGGLPVVLCIHTEKLAFLHEAANGRIPCPGLPGRRFREIRAVHDVVAELGADDDIVRTRREPRTHIGATRADARAITAPAVKNILRELRLRPVQGRFKLRTARQRQTVVEHGCASFATGWKQGVAFQCRPVGTLAECGFFLALLEADRQALRIGHLAAELQEGQLLVGAGAAQAIARAIFHVVAAGVDEGSEESHLARDPSIQRAAEATAVIAEPAGTRNATKLLTRREQIRGVAGAKADRAADGAEAGGGFPGPALDLDGVEQFRLDGDAADVME